MHRYELDREFNMRIQHNFKLYVMITSNVLHMTESAILDAVYRLDGYKCHKSVKYGPYTSHIHVKFEKEESAQAAVEHLNATNRGLTVILVDDMLRDWYIYEMRTCCQPRCSLTIIDVIGNTPFNVNFLTSNILNSILKDFGEPYLLPYTAALNKLHVQVVFTCMTEALAACIVFGEWYHVEEKVDSFFYRVRINPSKMEELLISNCGGTPSEAFKLDYFFIANRDMKTETASGLTNKGKASKSKISRTKETQKLHQQNFPPVLNAESCQIDQYGNTVQIIYIPIIATSYYVVPPVDVTTAVLNFQQTLTTQTVVAMHNSETENSDLTQFSNSNEISQSIHYTKLEHVQKTSTHSSNRIHKTYSRSSKSKKKRSHHDSRIFERRV